MADFKQIKEQVTIEAAAQFLNLELRSTGQALRGPCPACQSGGDRALVVTPSKQLFYCFAQGIGGDVISLWGHIQKCSPADAGRQIADMFGVGTVTSAPRAPVNRSPTAPQKKEGRVNGPHTFDPEAFAAKLQFTENVAALGLDETTAREFRIGEYKGFVYIPYIYLSGSLAGWGKLVEGKLERPKHFLPDSSTVVPFKRPA